MKDDVIAAIARGIVARRDILASMTSAQKVNLLEQLFVDLFGDQHVTLQKWAALTGQSAQVDTGYIAQFVASIVLGEPGQGFRGKGDDLADGSEVKSAANISGVDRPRWNHNLGTIAGDAERRAKNLPSVSDEYLAVPYMFYLLVDRPVVAVQQPGPVPFRIRAWCVDAQHDQDWRALVTKFVTNRGPKQYNFQLHPPVGYDDDLVVNTLGNLDFADVLVFDARLDLRHRDSPVVSWAKPLIDPVLPVKGRTVAKPYGASKRPSRLTAASDLVADVSALATLFPDLSWHEVQVAIEATTNELSELDGEERVFTS